jgi:hypothetical protein
MYKPLGTVWLKHAKRRFYRGIELSPNGNGNVGYYNMWNGWSVEPKKGEWPLFRQHIDLLANHNVEHARYIVQWLAETVQHPDRPIGVAIAFRGSPGTGKSTFGRWFGSLFGCHFLHLDSESRMLGRFNAHLHQAILVLADEAVWAAGKQGLGALKRMITEPTLAIERKGIDTITVKNLIHMLVASNDDWVVPVGLDDRRFAVFTVSKQHARDTKFFGAVHDELFKKGGLAALLYDMLAYKSDVDLKDIPDTEERREQKFFSLTPIDEWWRGVLEDGLFWQKDDLIEDSDEVRILRSRMYETYVVSVERAHKRWNLGSQSALGRYLKKLLPPPYPLSARTIHGGPMSYILPSLAECRAFYDTSHGHTEWDDNVVMRPALF